jgi:hypothetical protein
MYDSSKMDVIEDMGCNMRKIITILLIGSVMVCFAFAPMERQVRGANNTISIDFDPDANVSIDVWPIIYNFSQIYANSSKATSYTYFTIWNNGTQDNMTTDIQITTSPGNFTVAEDSSPTGMEQYGLLLKGGTADGANQWLGESGTNDLDNDTDTSNTATFGFVLQISGIWENYSWNTLVLTLTGVAS